MLHLNMNYSKIKSLFDGNKKIFNSASWLISEKVIILGLAFVSNVFVARYLGPAGYGVISYGLSLVALFSIVTHFGLRGLSIREMVKSKYEQEEVLGSIFYLKLFGSIIAFILCAIFIFFTENQKDENFLVLIIFSVTILFKPLEVVDFWFYSKVLGKYSAISRIIAGICSNSLKILFVLLNLSIIYLSLAYSFYIFGSLIIMLLYYQLISEISIKKWKVNFKAIKYYLNTSYYVLLATLFSLVYLKVDQIMLRWLVGDFEVGIYAVAVQISEAWYFIPNIIISSVFPKLIANKSKSQNQYILNLKKILQILIVLSIFVALIVSFFSYSLISSLYGIDYINAYIVLIIHIWAGVFISIKAVFMKWIFIEEFFKLSVYTQLIGAVSNIVLNLFLIPNYFSVGAAIATLISYMIASILSLLLFKKGREFLKIVISVKSFQL